MGKQSLIYLWLCIIRLGILSLCGLLTLLFSSGICSLERIEKFPPKPTNHLNAKMKHLLLTTIAAVVLVGTAFADPIHDAAKSGDLAGVQAELDKGANVNAKNQNYLPAIIIIISALFLLIIPIAFGFSALSAATIKTKRIVQIVATVMLALATVGVGLIWIMLAVVGAFQQLSYDMKHGQAEFDLPMVVYYSPWYIIALWIVNLIVFFRDMFTRKNREVST